MRRVFSKSDIKGLKLRKKSNPFLEEITSKIIFELRINVIHHSWHGAVTNI